MAKSTKDVESVSVRPVSTLRIAQTFQRQMKHSGIPFFNHIASNTTLSRYFLNRGLYVDLLGDAIFIADGFVRNAIVDEIIPYLQERCSYYRIPGIWTHDLTTTAMLAVNIVPFKDDSSKMYLTAEPVGVAPADVDGKDKYPDGMFMEFTEFNSTRLRQVVENMRSRAMSTILEQVYAHYPATMVRASPSSTIDDAIVELFKTTAHTKDLSVDITSVLGQPPTEKAAMLAINAVEKPIIRFVSIMMRDSGVSSEMVNEMFNRVKLHALYDTTADCIANTTVTYVFAFPDMLPDKDTMPFLQIPFEFTISEIVNIAQIGEGCKKPTKTQIKQFATKMRTLINRLSQTVIAMAINRHTEG